MLFSVIVLHVHHQSRVTYYSYLNSLSHFEVSYYWPLYSDYSYKCLYCIHFLSVELFKYKTGTYISSSTDL